MVSHSVARVEMWGELVGALSYDVASGLCENKTDLNQN